jgi:hypothetical protein
MKEIEIYYLLHPEENDFVEIDDGIEYEYQVTRIKMYPKSP